LLTLHDQHIPPRVGPIARASEPTDWPNPLMKALSEGTQRSLNRICTLAKLITIEAYLVTIKGGIMTHRTTLTSVLAAIQGSAENTG